MNQFISLGTILQNINNYKWSDALFLSDEDEWNEDTEGVILDPNDVEEEKDEIPKFAKNNNLLYALCIATIQEIVDNAYQQKKGCTTEDLFDAFLNYYNCDAFIIFDK